MYIKLRLLIQFINLHCCG